MQVPWDFVLWLYRQRTGINWQQLEETPRWRIERDLAYMGLENQAAAWNAHQAEQRRRFDAKRAAYLQAMGR